MKQLTISIQTTQSHTSLSEEVRHVLSQISESAVAKGRKDNSRRISSDILVRNTGGPGNQESVNLRIPSSKKSKRGSSPTAQRTENDMDDVDAFGNLFDSNVTGDSGSG